MFTALVILFAPTVYAFTNGTLLPIYLCGEPGDGFPKSLGGVIPYLVLGTNTTAYNQFPPGPGSIPININDGVKPIAGDALSPSAQQIIGSFHNGQPETGYIKAIKNLITIVPTDFTNFNTGVINPNFHFHSNMEYKLSIVVNLPTFNPVDVALDGAFVYAIDTVTTKRIGWFIVTGPNMQVWNACSMFNTYPRETGIVHTQLLSETAIYSGIVWRAPNNLKGNVTFIGAGVTDAGYGPFSVQYPGY